MRSTLQPGLSHRHSFLIPESKLVPALYPEAEEFLVMPHVFATGFLVGLLEWTCIRLINPHLEWPREMTLGTHIAVSHEAPTPPGRTVEVTALLTEVAGRRLEFQVQAHDGVALISQGTHQRHIIDHERFLARLEG